MAAPNAWCRRCWRHIRAGAGWAACGGSTGCLWRGVEAAGEDRVGV